MGLIKALMGAAGGTMADQWKEYFYCEAMDADMEKPVSDDINRGYMDCLRCGLIKSLHFKSIKD